MSPQNQLSFIPSGSNLGSEEYAKNHPPRRDGISYLDLLPEESIIYSPRIHSH